MTSPPHAHDLRDGVFVAKPLRRRAVRGALWIAVWITVLALLASSDLPGAAHARTSLPQAARTDPTEYEVKAVCLQRISTPYVKWPDAAFESKTAPFVVTVLGKDPFGKVLDEVFKDKKVGEHPVKLVRCSSVDELEPCRMLFVTKSQEKHLEKIKAACKDKYTLVVAESISAAENGAHIGVYLEDAHLRFAINSAAAKQAKLEISSELLKLAKLVGEKAEGGR